MVYLNVERVRKAKGITKARLARELKLSPMGYTHISKGEVRLDAERLKIIADTLGVEPAVFYDTKLTDSVVLQLYELRASS